MEVIVRTVRKAKGHTIVHALPVLQDHGRPLATVAAARPRVDAGDPAARYALGQVERALARATKDRSRERTARRRAERARHALLLETDGLGQVEAINRALTADGGAAIRCAAKAHVDVRPYASQAALTLVSLVREHAVETTAGLAYLGSAAAWLALERWLLDRTFAGADPDKDLFKMASTAGASARHALGWALHVEAEARAARPAAPFPWLAAHRAAAARRTSPDASDDGEVGPGDDDVPEADDRELEQDPDDVDQGDERDSGTTTKPGFRDSAGLSSQLDPDEAVGRRRTVEVDQHGRRWAYGPGGRVPLGPEQVEGAPPPSRFDRHGNVKPVGRAGPSPAAIERMEREQRQTWNGTRWVPMENSHE
jgi:hypothetical protein